MVERRLIKFENLTQDDRKIIEYLLEQYLIGLNYLKYLDDSTREADQKRLKRWLKKERPNDWKDFWKEIQKDLKERERPHRILKRRLRRRIDIDYPIDLYELESDIHECFSPKGKRNFKIALGVSVLRGFFYHRFNKVCMDLIEKIINKACEKYAFVYRFIREPDEIKMPKKLYYRSREALLMFYIDNRSWTLDDLIEESKTDEQLRELLNLLGGIKGLFNLYKRYSLKEKIASLFQELRGKRMKSARKLKDVISLLAEIDFNYAEDSHVLSQVYEELLLRLGREGGVAGKLYTQRPIVRLMTKLQKAIVRLMTKLEEEIGRDSFKKLLKIEEIMEAKCAIKRYRGDSRPRVCRIDW